MGRVSKSTLQRRASLAKINQARKLAAQNKKKNLSSTTRARIRVIRGGNSENDDIVVVKVEVEEDEGNKDNENFNSMGAGEDEEDNEERCCLVCSQATKLTLKKLRGVKSEDLDRLVIYFLQEILLLPEEKVQEYVADSGMGKPREWLAFCNHCQGVIGEVFRAQMQIEELNNKINSFQKEVTDRIRMTYWKEQNRSEEKTDADSDLVRITRETRIYVATGAWQVKNKSAAFINVPSPLSSSSSYLDSPLETLDQEDESINLEVDTEVLVPPENVTVSKVASSPTPTPIIVHKQLGKRTTTKYLCPFCPQLEPMKRLSFARHVIFHYEHPYKCSQCHTYFKTGTESELFRSPDGSTGTNHTCTAESIEKMPSFKPGKVWKCAHCFKLFESEEERTLHESHAHADKPFFMNTCTTVCMCSECSKALRSEEEWRLHRALEHPELAQFGCDHCEEVFSRKSTEGIDILDVHGLKSHIQKIHTAKKPRIYSLLECRMCGANFKSYKPLKNHIGVHHGAEKFATAFECPVCFQRFSSSGKQQKHLLRAHFPRDKFVCDMCGYENSMRVMLMEHKLLQHGENPEDGRPVVQCTQENCSYKTVIKSFLQTHMMKAHNAERRHKCKICGKGFLHSTQKTGHERIHLNANNKPFQCEICGNSFAVKNYLYIHMRLSHQNRPFASTHKKRQTKRRKTKQRVAEINPPQQITPEESHGEVETPANLQVVSETSGNNVDFLNL